VLEVHELRVGYGKHEVLRNISLTVAPGEVLAVLGTNGAGKSTLLNCIAGLVPATSGSVSFLGADITRRPAWARPALGMSLVPEGQQAFPTMTVLENLWVGGQANPDAAGRFDANLAKVFDLFPRLAERRSQPAGTLSGGERQMLAVGRALVCEPRLLLLDEPSHGLAPLIIEQLADLIDMVAEHTSLLIVEQNLLIPTQCATRVLVLDNSRVVMEGPAACVLESDFVTATYLGADVPEAAAAPEPVSDRARRLP
jgi:branched-chain amino acid transport system ATP-binding protein